MKASLSEWKEFLESNVYKDIQEELSARYNVILPKLIAGKDLAWSDDCMRGRLDELEFAASIASDTVDALELEADKKHVKKEGSFMSTLFKNFMKTKERDDARRKHEGPD